VLRFSNVIINFIKYGTKWLKVETGWNVKSFYILQLNSEADEVIYRKAKEKGNVIIISKDSDFPNLVNNFGDHQN